jgi:hypothetical protein
MAAWKFTDDYGTQYPALGSSILNFLVFSDHAITGTAFTGTLDVAATGPALKTLGLIVNMTSIAVAGTVTNANNALDISLASSDTAAFTAGVAKSIPLIGGSITQSAGLSILVKVTTTDDPDLPTTNTIDLSITFAVGARSVTVSCQVPMSGGLTTITGTFTGVGISLNDLQFLMGGLSSSKWFPSTELGPYTAGSPAFELLGVTLDLYIVLSPFSITVSSVTVQVGITNIPIMGQKLYLDPLAVWVTISSLSTNPTASWSIEGKLVLCNYARQGDPKNPDFTFDLQMNLTEFTITGDYGNPSSLPVTTMIQDLIGAGTDIGLPPKLTIDTFDFSTQADKKTGSISSFSTEIAMSGGFGLFDNFDLESFELSLENSA